MTITVSTYSGLMNALASATGGETIALAGGNYGSVSLNNLNFASEVRIVSQNPSNPAVFAAGSQISHSQNLTLDGLVVDAVGDTLPWAAALYVDNSQGIAIRNTLFDGDEVGGYAVGRGLDVQSSSGLILDGNTFTKFYLGTFIYGVQNVTVVNNETYAIRSDGYNFVTVDNVLIEGNYIHDFKPNSASGDHADMIQFFTYGETVPSTNVTIRGNILDSGNGGWTQSLFMGNEMGSDRAMYYRNFLVENNLIYNSHLWGIGMGEVDGVIIRNNTVLQNPATTPVMGDGLWEPQISVNGGSVNVQVYGNISHLISGPGNVHDNLTITAAQIAAYFDGSLTPLQPLNFGTSLDLSGATTGSGGTGTTGGTTGGTGGTTGDTGGTTGDTGGTTGDTGGTTGDTGGTTGDTGGTTGDTGGTTGDTGGTTGDTGGTTGDTGGTGGPDAIPLAAGAQTIAGSLAALDGSVYSGFGSDDSIALTNGGIARDQITITPGSAIIDVDLDHDGVSDGTIKLQGDFSGGDFMTTHSGGKTILTYHDYLSVAEGHRLDAGNAAGIVNQAYLNGDTAHSFQVTISPGSQAGYNNTVGAYEVDAAGNIVDVQILSANANADAGNSFTVNNVESGHDLGFFLVQNGGRTLDPSVFSDGNLSFVQRSDGSMALADNGVVIGNANTFLSHDPSLNFDGAQHVASGVAGDGSGALMIGFEDLDYQSGPAPDADFQDVMLQVEAHYGFG